MFFWTAVKENNMSENVTKMHRPVISLCIPTNGIAEWVIPVIDNIYSQGVDCSEFEVVVTDNGKNDDFKKVMEGYASLHPNLKYSKNDSYMFYNQIEALNIAEGIYLKFLNHRTLLEKGALSKLISIIHNNESTKPVLYFSNGVIKGKPKLIECTTFDEFVRELGIFASWTTGVGIWSEDYNRIKNDLVIDEISPHSCVLFSKRKEKSYKIYNFVFSKEVTDDHSKKGTYNLFKAFAVEEPTITVNLYKNGDVSLKTLKKVLKDYRRFVSDLYFDFCVIKKKCSYDLSGFAEATAVYYSKNRVVAESYLRGCVRYTVAFLAEIKDKIKRRI